MPRVTPPFRHSTHPPTSVSKGIPSLLDLRVEQPMPTLPSTGSLLKGTSSALAPGRGRIRPGSQSEEEVDRQTRRSRSPATRRSEVSNAASRGGCWNCGKEGHGYRSCPYAWTKRFCFRCGNKGVDVHTCTHCPERISLRVGRQDSNRAVVPRIRDPRVQAAPVAEVRELERIDLEPSRTAVPGQASQPVMIIMSGAVVHLGTSSHLPP